MFGVSDPEEVRDCFDLLYAAYDVTHMQSKLSVSPKPLKIIINFSQMDSDTEPREVETDRCPEADLKEVNTTFDHAWVSTRANDVSNSDNSGGDLAIVPSSLNNEEE